MDYPWYTIIDGHDVSLEQGDLFSNLPVIEPFDDVTDHGVSRPLQARAQLYNAIVRSQSCDLRYDKLDSVLLCPVFTVDELADSHEIYQGKQGSKTFEEIRRGVRPNQHMLNACSLSGHERPVQVVSFSQVFALPLSYVKRHAAKEPPRLRLLHPYREHLAQAFARFIMRVGLPEDIASFR